MILKTVQELNLDHGVNTWVPEEDLAFGKELYSIFKCQIPVVEAAKLSQLFRHLLTNHKLNTVVASTMHNIQAGDKDFSAIAINMWYKRLDKRYNFSLGPAILPLLKTDNLTRLAKLDPPYMKDFKASIDENQLGNITKFFGKTFNKDMLIRGLYDKCIMWFQEKTHPK